MAYIDILTVSSPHQSEVAKISFFIASLSHEFHEILLEKLDQKGGFLDAKLPLLFLHSECRNRHGGIYIFGEKLKKTLLSKLLL